MIVPPAPLVALLPPAADIAMIHRFGICLLKAGFHRVLKSPFDHPVIRAKRGEPVRFWFKRNTWPNHIKQCRIKSLNIREKLRVETELQNSLRLGIPRKLAIDDFVRPIAKSTSFFLLFHAKEHITSASPFVLTKTALNNDRRAARHGRNRLLARIFIQLFGKVDNGVSLRAKALNVSFFVFETPLLKNSQVGILPGGLFYLAFRQANIKRRQML